MSGFIYKEIECKSACNNVRGGFPYRWDLNAYRGCGHSCKYCFALYTHRYMESDDFFNEIYVKTNIAERLEILLRSKSWKGDVINLGGVTDSYQPAEERYRLMPEIWKLLIRYKNPAIISTKSDLILRDFELIEELAATAGVNVASTITCSDENDREKIEPGAVSSERRFRMLEIFKRETKASTGMHIMPVIPFITDRRENLESLFSKGRAAGIDYALVQPMNLRGETKNTFLSFARAEYPEYYDRLCEMYKTGYVPKEYKECLYKTVRPLMKAYKISSDCRSPINKIIQELKTPEYRQISLFD